MNLDELTEDLLTCVSGILCNAKYDVLTNQFLVPSDAYIGLLESYTNLRAEMAGVVIK